MSTNDENFPQIPTAAELLAEVREREAQSELPRTNSNGHGMNSDNNLDLPAVQYTPVENLRAPYPNEIAQYDQQGFEPLKAYRDYDLEHAQRPTFEVRHEAPVTIDSRHLLKAYAEFTAEQTNFLERGAGMRGEQYTQAVSRYSRAQTALIRAQADALRQLGVL